MKNYLINTKSLIIFLLAFAAITFVNVNEVQAGSCTLSITPSSVCVGGSVTYAGTYSGTPTLPAAGFNFYWYGTNVINGVTTTVTKVQASQDSTVPFNYTWSNIPSSAIGTYTRYFRAFNSDGVTQVCQSPTQSLSVGPPDAPTNLSASVPSSYSQINLSWTDKSSNETGFKIERSKGNNTSWSQLATVSANTTSYTHNVSASELDRYYYRVKAYNGCGDSSPSNEVNAVPRVLCSLNITTTPASAPLSVVVGGSVNYSGSISPSGSSYNFYWYGKNNGSSIGPVTDSNDSTVPFNYTWSNVPSSAIGTYERYFKAVSGSGVDLCTSGTAYLAITDIQCNALTSCSVRSVDNKLCRDIGSGYQWYSDNALTTCDKLCKQEKCAGTTIAICDTNSSGTFTWNTNRTSCPYVVGYLRSFNENARFETPGALSGRTYSPFTSYNRPDQLVWTNIPGSTTINVIQGKRESSGDYCNYNPCEGYINDRRVYVSSPFDLKGVFNEAAPNNPVKDSWDKTVSASMGEIVKTMPRRSWDWVDPVYATIGTIDSTNCEPAAPPYNGWYPPGDYTDSYFFGDYSSSVVRASADQFRIDCTTGAITYSCTGVPTNATVCSGDDTGLVANTAATVVGSCVANATKCEYTCNSGYTQSGNSCIATPPCTPNCSCAANVCVGSTCNNGCGGSCAGTMDCSCTPNCSCAANTCTGQTCSNGCSGTCNGTKDCKSGEYKEVAP